MIGAALDAEYERLSGKSASDIARAKLGASDLGQLLIDAGVAGAQIAADAAANTLIPGSSIVLKGVRSFGDASQEARKAGASIGQQVAYGGLAAGKDIALEKVADGFAGTYGKGLTDAYIKRRAENAIENEHARKAAERIVNIGGESLEAFFSSMLDSLLEDAYNGNEITEDYVSDAWHDAVRDAAIRGLLSGVSNAFDDAKKAAPTNAAKAIDRVTQASNIRKIQKDMRQLYVGTAQQDAESYASLVRLLEKKGNGRRW